MNCFNSGVKKRAVVHGHFYQPPRENPWTGAVERQPSAGRDHDWNARIARECYVPNGEARVVDGAGRIADLVDNYEWISFNFGPTLLAWYEKAHPRAYARLIEADRRSAQRLDGHGNALAQSYHHSILPLAHPRDRRTEIRWGLADFQHRFGRRAEGLWLPECAVDDATLADVAAEGVKFVMLEPHQAAGPVVPGAAYRWTGPAGETLALFFYDGPLSRAVAFERAMSDSRAYASRIAAAAPADGPCLIATDGESYGHHHAFGEMGLAHLLRYALPEAGVEPVNLAWWLAKHPPVKTVELKAGGSSWSCAHGLERWRSDCGCGAEGGRHQKWRAPLRDALERLRVRLAALYEEKSAGLLTDPWAARDAYVAVVLDRSAASVERFLAAHAPDARSPERRTTALKLLELQRHALMMFTSCGWFFDDVSGVECVQILQRAARAVDLAESMGERALAPFLERLSRASSNVRSFGDASEVYRRLVAPTRATLERVAAHAAVLDHCGLWPFPLPAVFGARLGPAFRADKDGLAGRRPSLSLRPVCVERGETLERGEWHALAHRADRLDFACWLLPPGAAPDAAELGARFLALDDAAFRAEMDSRFGVSRWGLDAVLSDERSELVKALASEGSLGAARAEFLRLWTQAVVAARFAERGDDALLELLESAPEHAFLPGDLPWARTLEELMHRRLEAALEGEGLPAYSRALRWLDALWKAQLLTGTWRLRDFQRRWSARLAGPSAERDACRALGERLGLAEALLEKAG